MDADRVKADSSELVAKAKDGDRHAFNRLVQLHQHEVFALAVRLVGDRELAADVAQEALVRAWRGLAGFRGDAKFSTWLHRITVNTARSSQRRWNRHRIEPIDEGITDVVSAGIGPEEIGVGAGLRSRLSAALAELSLPVRMVVVLKDVYDWSHPEIAEHLGISVTAAKVRLHRGHKRLRTILGPEMRDR